MTMAAVMSFDPDPSAQVVALQRAALAGDLDDPNALDLEALERRFADATPEVLLAWAAERFGDGLVVSTSFGIHSAVTLHMVSQVAPKAPVIWVDTGYLPQETYRFADQLTERLRLNLQAVQSPLSPARMEATLGRLWESDDPAELDRYDRIRKVEPMRRALDELGSTAWVSGIRAEQTAHRATLPRVDRSGERFKISPILHWTTRQMHEYLVANELPLHPLFYEGYATVGDAHSSRALSQDDGHERETRFRGLKQECGLHLSDEQVVSLDSSAL
jgi:phosphoadenosine phosphosulfate reductase